MLRINLLALFLFDAPDSLTIEILTLSNARETQIFNSPNYIENQVNDVISKGSFKYLSTIQTKPYLEIFRVSWLLADREMST